jgi:hypothetical protein
MSDLRLYRFAFAPALLTLVVLAFSLQGVPSPAEPPPATLEFDASEAGKTAREIIAAGERRPGSEADNAVADLVAERFRSVVSGTLGEQTVETTVEGDDTEIRNVLLTLPGSSDNAIVVLAGRDSREGEGAPSSAAATALLLGLVDSLAVADRERTLIFASTSASSAEGQGARELIEGLPEDTIVDAVVVVSQPGYDEPFGPHLVISGGGASPPIGLAMTAEETLRDRAMLSPGRISALEQVARYAIPAASGDQAGLLADGIDAVAISSAGELPLPASDAARDRLDTGTLERLGPAILGLVSAIDSASAPPEDGPGNYLRVGDNLVPGWIIGLVVLALLVPPAALSASVLARARREGSSVRRSAVWALEWWLPPLVFCLGIYVLSLVGAIPASGVPYDPSRYELGVGEGLTLIVLGALAAWLWWLLHLRRLPGARDGGGRDRRAAGGAAGLLAVIACVLVWLANPYLALVLVPLVHVVAVLGTGGSRPGLFVFPVLVVAAIPFAAALVYVSTVLDWGLSAPWQLAVLMAGGGVGPLEAVAGSFVLASVAAVALTAIATLKAQPPTRGKSGVDPSGAR